MPRIARLVVPNIPHHITQRGNRRQPTFFSDADFHLYKKLLAECCAKAGTKIMAWCLMPNHVHLILVPNHEDGLRAALGETHRRYTWLINAREGWRGHLWQERFASCPMDEAHTAAALRYVELNPVRAKLVENAEDWRWSSARAHLYGEHDNLTDLKLAKPFADDWRTFLDEGLQAEAHAAIQASEKNGRALGAASFINDLAALSGRDLDLPTRGRPRTR